MAMLFHVLVTIGVLAMIEYSPVYSNLCSNENDVDLLAAAGNSSLIFEARPILRRQKPDRKQPKAMNWRVITVHRGKKTMKTQSNVMISAEPCENFRGNVTYLIFANNPQNGSRSSRLHPLVLLPKGIFLLTSNASLEFLTRFCDSCNKPMVQIKRRKVEVKETDKIEFTCEVTGNPLPTVHWTKNHNLLTSNSHLQVLTKRRGSQLKIDNATVSDAGLYRCHARNDAGLTAFALTEVIVAAKVCKHGSSTCKDQTFCLNGGICCNGKTRLTNKYCVCSELYIGDRCESRVYGVNDEVIGQVETVYLAGNTEMHIAVIITIIAAMLAIVLMIVIGVMWMKIRRQSKQSSTTRKQLATQRHCYRGNNKSVYATSPVPFVIASSDFQVSPVEVTTEGGVFPVQATVEDDCKSGVERDAMRSTRRDDSFDEIVERRSNGTVSTQSLNVFKWESSDLDENNDDDDDVKANRASAANVLDVDDRCVTSTSRGGGETSAMSSRYEGDGDTTSWTHDDDSDDDVEYARDRLLRQLYAYTSGEDPSLDDFAVGGVLPSLRDYIGVEERDSVSNERDIELVPTSSSGVS